MKVEIVSVSMKGIHLKHLSILFSTPVSLNLTSINQCQDLPRPLNQKKKKLKKKHLIGQDLMIFYKLILILTLILSQKKINIYAKNSKMKLAVCKIWNSYSLAKNNKITNINLKLKIKLMNIVLCSKIKENAKEWAMRHWRKEILLILKLAIKLWLKMVPKRE